MGTAQGGSFKNGFASGALGSLGGSAFGAVGGDFAKTGVGMTSFSALSGGVGAELSGGNFWQGAGTGATIGLLNHTGEILQEKIVQNKYEKRLSERLKKATLYERRRIYLDQSVESGNGFNPAVDFNIKGLEFKKGILTQNANVFNVKVYVGKNKYVDGVCHYLPSGNKSRNLVTKIKMPVGQSSSYGFTKKGYNIQFMHRNHYAPATLILNQAAYDKFSSFLYGL